ncbi:MAG: hypothetical protein FWB95_04070 [Treponema sp.]|nr:hypothetical protein [Treponema sp.]
MGGIAFQNVAGLDPHKTRFDWYKEKKFDCNFGELIPIFVQEVAPNDYWHISNETLCRCTPLVAPVMHECSIDTHYFFVPARILDDMNANPGGGNPYGDPLMLGDNAPPANRFSWQLFITGGFDGMDNQTLPRWVPSGKNFVRPTDRISQNVPAPYKYSLWDYLGLPVLPDGVQWASPLTPVDFLRRAYNFIYNEYYRDETLEDPVTWRNENILLRSWRKDYFTSSLPFQQRGLAPAIPVNISGVLNAIFDNALITSNSTTPVALGMSTTSPYKIGGGSVTINTTTEPGYISLVTGNNQYLAQALNNNVINSEGKLSGTSIDVSDLRQIVQLQKFLERNARAGARLPEFILAHFGVHMGDASLQRPEYIGGTKTPLVISEVLQTSQSDTTDQGNMSGHGISYTENHVGTYHAKEHGYIIGLQSVMPKPSYQQGINRQWLRKTRYDFLVPEFVNLSEQEILQGEIYIANDSTDEEIFGFQGVYDELRTQNSEVCGAFRDTLNYWHLGRIFDNAPQLNADFIHVNPLYLTRIFFVQNEPGLLCDVSHTFYAVRCLPEIAEPGLLDHH